MTGYLYDTGVLIAAERGERTTWALHRRLLEQGIRPSVPSTVLAQAWRGGPQPQLSRLLAGCAVRGFTEVEARMVGKLLSSSRTADIVDASVVIFAQQRAEILTSDPGDVGPLAELLRDPKPQVRSLGGL